MRGTTATVETVTSAGREGEPSGIGHRSERREDGGVVVQGLAHAHEDHVSRSRRGRRTRRDFAGARRRSFSVARRRRSACASCSRISRRSGCRARRGCLWRRRCIPSCTRPGEETHRVTRALIVAHHHSLDAMAILERDDDFRGGPCGGGGRLRDGGGEEVELVPGSLARECGKVRERGILEINPVQTVRGRAATAARRRSRGQCRSAVSRFSGPRPSRQERHQCGDVQKRATRQAR